MAVITLRIDDVEAAFVRRCARLEGKTVADFIRDAVFEKVEDRERLEALRRALAEEDGESLVQDQVLAELRL